MNVVVTGSNSGFGRLTTEALARAGHTVFATMRATNERNRAHAEAMAKIPNVHVVDMDVTSDASVDAAIASIAQTTGGAIDAVVNNAGRFSMGVQEVFGLDEVKDLFETNVFGPLRVNRAVLPHMRARRSGLVVHVSSVVGRFSLPTMGTYSATKYALEALGEAQRDELAPLGIDVAIVEPGAFPTNVGVNAQYGVDDTRGADYGAVAQIPEKIGAGLGQLFASPQAPNPQDVADAIAALVAMPAGQRPLRTVVDNLSGDPARNLNAHHDGQRVAILAAFGLA